MNRTKAACAALLVGIALGCGSSEQKEERRRAKEDEREATIAARVPRGHCRILTVPEGATVLVDGKKMGETPCDVQFDWTVKEIYELKLVKAGYQDLTIDADKMNRAFRSKSVVLTLEKRALDLKAISKEYAVAARELVGKQTTGSEATNAWLKMPVTGGAALKESWQKVVDAVTGTHDGMEQLDQQSGYLRTTAKQRLYKVDEPLVRRTIKPPKLDDVLMLVQAHGDEWAVRSKVVCTVASPEPLEYKIKLVSEWAYAERGRRPEEWQWETFDRAFPEDAEMVAQLQKRLATGAK